MLDWSVIIPSIVATLAGAGWFKTWRDRRKDNEAHARDMIEREADIIAKMRESETKYVHEILDTYNQQVVNPIREQSLKNAENLARFEGAVAAAPTCRIYPDCVILRKLQSQAEADDIDPC